MILFWLFVVVVVVAVADALISRRSLRVRATQYKTRKPRHEIVGANREGWRRLDEIENVEQRGEDVDLSRLFGGRGRGR
jgi:hypothetical protein